MTQNKPPLDIIEEALRDCSIYLMPDYTMRLIKNALAETQKLRESVPDDLGMHIKNVNDPTFYTSSDTGWKSVVEHDKAAKALHDFTGGRDDT